MKKKTFLLAVSLVSLMIATSVGAQANVPINPDLGAILIEVVRWLVWLLIFAAGIAIVAAGYIFVTSAGNADKVTQARNIIIYALVGILVAALCWGLVGIARRMVGI